MRMLLLMHECIQLVNICITVLSKFYNYIFNDRNIHIHICSNRTSIHVDITTNFLILILVISKLLYIVHDSEYLKYYTHQHVVHIQSIVVFNDCMYICVWKYVSVAPHMCMYAHECVFVCACVCVCVRVCVRMYSYLDESETSSCIFTSHKCIGI